MGLITRKVCMLGDQAVGKTSIINRYVYDIFDDRYKTTIGSKVSKKRLKLATGEELNLHIWDLLGQRTFKLHPVYYQGARGGVVVCDTTRDETLESVAEWAVNFRRYVGNVPLIMFANKIDLRREMKLDMAEAKEEASIFGAEVVMTSARTGEGLDRGFSRLAASIMNEEEER